MEEWKNLKEGNWMNEVNVRDFIQKNYTSYQDDESFLANKTDKTNNVQLDYNLVGKRLAEVREKNNLTLRKLADVLNTTSSTLSAYETGKVLIQTSFAITICTQYNVSLDWLCGRK